MNIKSFQLVALFDFDVMVWCVYFVLFYLISLYGELRVLLREVNDLQLPKRQVALLFINVPMFYYACSISFLEVVCMRRLPCFAMSYLGYP